MHGITSYKVEACVWLGLETEDYDCPASTTVLRTEYGVIASSIFQVLAATKNNHKKAIVM